MTKPTKITPIFNIFAGAAMGSPPEEESALLAAPGRRDDEGWIKVKKNGSYKTDTSKKYYKKKAVDKRPQGARTRHLSSIHTPEFGTPRTTDLGFSGLKSLSVGISEHNGPNYRDEEKRLMEISNEVKTLITELENKKDEVEAQ